MEVLILGWYILTETGSVLLLTVYSSLQYSGTLIAPMFGMAGDRFGHRTVLCAMRLAYAVMAALLMIMASPERCAAVRAGDRRRERSGAALRPRDAPDLGGQHRAGGPADGRDGSRAHDVGRRTHFRLDRRRLAGRLPRHRPGLWRGDALLRGRIDDDVRDPPDDSRRACRETGGAASRFSRKCGKA